MGCFVILTVSQNESFVSTEKQEQIVNVNVENEDEGHNNMIIIQSKYLSYICWIGVLFY